MAGSWSPWQGKRLVSPLMEDGNEAKTSTLPLASPGVTDQDAALTTQQDGLGRCQQLEELRFNSTLQIGNSIQLNLPPMFQAAMPVGWPQGAHLPALNCPQELYDMALPLPPPPPPLPPVPTQQQQQQQPSRRQSSLQDLQNGSTEVEAKAQSELFVVMETDGQQQQRWQQQQQQQQPTSLAWAYSPWRSRASSRATGLETASFTGTDESGPLDAGARMRSSSVSSLCSVSSTQSSMSVWSDSSAMSASSKGSVGARSTNTATSSRSTSTRRGQRAPARRCGPMGPHAQPVTPNETANQRELRKRVECVNANSNLGWGIPPTCNQFTKNRDCPMDLDPELPPCGTPTMLYHLEFNGWRIGLYQGVDTSLWTHTLAQARAERTKLFVVVALEGGISMGELKHVEPFPLTPGNSCAPFAPILRVATEEDFALAEMRKPQQEALKKECERLLGNKSFQKINEAIDRVDRVEFQLDGKYVVLFIVFKHYVDWNALVGRLRKACSSKFGLNTRIFIHRRDAKELASAASKSGASSDIASDDASVDASGGRGPSLEGS